MPDLFRIPVSYGYQDVEMETERYGPIVPCPAACHELRALNELIDLPSGVSTQMRFGNAEASQ